MPRHIPWKDDPGYIAARKIPGSDAHAVAYDAQKWADGAEPWQGAIAEVGKFRWVVARRPGNEFRPVDSFRGAKRLIKDIAEGRVSFGGKLSSADLQSRHDGLEKLKTAEFGLALQQDFDMESILSYFHDGLGATITIAGEQGAIEIPDYGMRLQYLKLMLGYRNGLPVARKEVLTARPSTDDELRAKLKKSPAFRAAMTEALLATNEFSERDVTPGDDA